MNRQNLRPKGLKAPALESKKPVNTVTPARPLSNRDLNVTQKKVDLAKMTVEEVANWIELECRSFCKDAQAMEYSQKFRENAVCGQAVKIGLSESNLKDIGIKNVGHKVILAHRLKAAAADGHVVLPAKEGTVVAPQAAKDDPNAMESDSESSGNEPVKDVPLNDEPSAMKTEKTKEGADKENARLLYNCFGAGGAAPSAGKASSQLKTTKCWKCGIYGHKAAACSKKEKICFACGQEGHHQFDKICKAPKNQWNRCWNCGNTGHITRKCPEPRGAENGNGLCFVCWEVGHISNACPKRCTKCSENGGLMAPHSIDRCPMNGQYKQASPKPAKKEEKTEVNKETKKERKASPKPAEARAEAKRSPQRSPVRKPMKTRSDPSLKSSAGKPKKLSLAAKQEPRKPNRADSLNWRVANKTTQRRHSAVLSRPPAVNSRFPEPTKRRNSLSRPHPVSIIPPMGPPKQPTKAPMKQPKTTVLNTARRHSTGNTSAYTRPYAAAAAARSRMDCSANLLEAQKWGHKMAQRAPVRKMQRQKSDMDLFQEQEEAWASSRTCIDLFQEVQIQANDFVKHNMESDRRSHVKRSPPGFSRLNARATHFEPAAVRRSRNEPKLSWSARARPGGLSRAHSDRRHIRSNVWAAPEDTMVPLGRSSTDPDLVYRRNKFENLTLEDLYSGERQYSETRSETPSRYVSFP